MITLKRVTLTLVMMCLLTANFVFAVGTVIERQISDGTASAIDNTTREIVRFEDVDPSLIFSTGCVVDYYNPTEQEARLGAQPVINEVLECPR